MTWHKFIEKRTYSRQFLELPNRHEISKIYFTVGKISIFQKKNRPNPNHLRFTSTIVCSFCNNRHLVISWSFQIIVRTTHEKSNQLDLMNCETTLTWNWISFSKQCESLGIASIGMPLWYFEYFELNTLWTSNCFPPLCRVSRVFIGGPIFSVHRSRSDSDGLIGQWLNRGF